MMTSPYPPSCAEIRKFTLADIAFERLLSRATHTETCSLAGFDTLLVRFRLQPAVSVASHCTLVDDERAFRRVRTAKRNEPYTLAFDNQASLDRYANGRRRRSCLDVMIIWKV